MDGMNQAEALHAALRQPQDVATIRAAAEAASLTLARCAAWLLKGDAVGAAALNADSGNLIGLYVMLQQSGQPLPAGLTLPVSPPLEDLAKLPATAMAHREEVDRWTTLNLEDAPLPDRLAAARTLRLLEPNNPMWKRIHDALEQAAVELWSGEVDRCLETGDPIAIASMARQVHVMEFLSAAGQRLVHTLDDAMQDLTKAAAAEKLQRIEDELHLAWAGMDVQRATNLIRQWRASAEAAGGSSEKPIRGIVRWLDTDRHRLSRERVTQNLTTDLVRALDELEPLHAVERKYAAALEAGAAIPAVVETRVAHRIADERRARARRYAIGAVAIIAIAASLAVIITIRQQGLDRARTIQNLSNCITSAIQTNQLPAALDCWGEAERAGLTMYPEMAAHRPAIERAEEAVAARHAAATDALRRGQETLQTEVPSLTSVQSAIAAIESSQSDLPTALRPEWDALMARATRLRESLLIDERADRLQELKAVESQLAKANPLPADLAGWTQRLTEARAAARTLAAIGLRPAADEITTKQRLTSLDHRASALRELAAERVARLEAGSQALDALSRPPVTETSWARTWDQLIAEYPDVIRAQDRADWARAAEAAAVAAAVEDWRARLPAIEEARLWSTTEPPEPSLVSGVRTSLQSHLDAHLDRSPYQPVAGRLIALASAMRDTQRIDPLDAAIEASGLLDLHRVETADGYVYLKRVNHDWHRLESQQDVKVPPAHLDKLSHEDQRVLFEDIEPSPPPAVSALHRGLEAWKAGPGPATAAELIRAIEQCDEKDSLLVLAILKSVWTALREPTLPLPAGISQRGGHWLDTLSVPAPTAVGADWIALAPQARSKSQHSVRQQARHAPHNAPTADDIQRAWQEEAADLASAAVPRVIGGLVLPDENSDIHANVSWAGTPTPQREILVRTPSGWVFKHLDLNEAADQLQWPANMPHAPAIIFITP